MATVFCAVAISPESASNRGPDCMRVGIIGVGMTAFRPSTPEYSWKELMFEAASRAYADTGVDPRTEVDSFVTCAEDYYEGFGIFDEFTPDQLGGALRPVCTVTGDGLQGLANAFMQIQTGLIDIAVVEARDWTQAAYAQLAAEMAYRLAKVRRPATEIDFAEVDDRFSYKELQHLEAVGLAKKGEAGRTVLKGGYDPGGALPVNVAGGSLGCGNVFEATGLHRAAEVALQLRGDAGSHQIDGVRVGVAQSWRYIPSATVAVAVLGVGR